MEIPLVLRARRGGGLLADGRSPGLGGAIALALAALGGLYEER
jgi:hypothetical protein